MFSIQTVSVDMRSPLGPMLSNKQSFCTDQEGFKKIIMMFVHLVRFWGMGSTGKLFSTPHPHITEAIVIIYVTKKKLSKI